MNSPLADNVYYNPAKLNPIKKKQPPRRFSLAPPDYEYSGMRLAIDDPNHDFLAEDFDEDNDSSE
jgi:hypothetical protein